MDTKFENYLHLLLVVLFFFNFQVLYAQKFDFHPNYDESKVPKYTLPDPLVLQNGQIVKDSLTWLNKRRPEILHLFEKWVYGKSPGKPEKMNFQILSVDSMVYKGFATRKLVRINLFGNGKNLSFDMLIYLPNHVKRPVPLFFGMNFKGNYTIWYDPIVPVVKTYVMNKGLYGEVSRGSSAQRWPVCRILERGYGLATVYYEDIDPDFDDGFQNGVHPLFYDKGKNRPAPDEWATIAAWAWGASRCMDYFEIDQDIDHKRVAIVGHSRLGKTALWAGAVDQRFALVISNDSGCGGAALFRRRFGETVYSITYTFPHWFCANFKNFVNKEDELPVDQHMLIALIAPRPVYVASAAQDLFADPRGEFLAAKYASPVYELFNKKGIPDNIEPKLNEPIMTTIGYHIREGKHDLTGFDWERFLDFADLHLKK